MAEADYRYLDADEMAIVQRMVACEGKDTFDGAVADGYVEAVASAVRTARDALAAEIASGDGFKLSQESYLRIAEACLRDDFENALDVVGDRGRDDRTGGDIGE